MHVLSPGFTHGYSGKIALQFEFDLVHCWALRGVVGVPEDPGDGVGGENGKVGVEFIDTLNNEQSEMKEMDGLDSMLSLSLSPLALSENILFEFNVNLSLVCFLVFR